ncbi:hypothetical protein HELRODRAFT_164063 [Helobdella robusta]|uniref:Endonuclease/exonuclease/phosphatase domain-containing protein n=1 Tax=Helobdella robusta TaxID=6412 RepID=T1EUV0_HELRO|nr:hypothetical protein HELRODRAFT_164063 [Helobdella robusta]ESN94257.1 hypothetical protein HELRODRAFT_164063 [Helobdella robusta]
MESRFLNCMRDLYLHQLISKATRFRTSQKSNILDLILVHDKDVVAKIDYYSPIGNSDHIVLVFILRHTWNLVIKRAKQKYNFNKGEYDKMRVYIRTELSKEMCVFKQVYNVVKLNEAWRKIKDNPKVFWQNINKARKNRGDIDVLHKLDGQGKLFYFQILIIFRRFAQWMHISDQATAKAIKVQNHNAAGNNKKTYE